MTGVQTCALPIFKDYNIPVGENRYNKFDSLENAEDLDLLFEVLKSVKDMHGRPAVITPVVNVANPNFEKIKESAYTTYYYEPFTETLNRYENGTGTYSKWQEGIRDGIFIPEYHGREHISVQHWLKELRGGDKKLLYAFEHNFVSVPMDNINLSLSEFRPEFYFDNASQIDFLKSSISDGTKLFRRIFGYIPRAFVPSNGIFHPVFERIVADSGIKNLYVNHFNSVPRGNGGLRQKYYRVGRTTSYGLTYYTRNCAFEPTDSAYQGISLTLRQIEAAFRWGKPANISTHRVNFVGRINPSNRETGLHELRKLLASIIDKWPDVEFMSTGEFLEYKSSVEYTDTKEK